MENVELKKGDFFTVKEWTRCTDYSYVGDCLEVLAIDGDFVRARNHNSRVSRDITLDLRAINIQTLSDEFVQSVIEPRKELKD